jgi:hypothetical protein
VDHSPALSNLGHDGVGVGVDWLGHPDVLPHLSASSSATSVIFAFGNFPRIFLTVGLSQREQTAGDLDA